MTDVGTKVRIIETQYVETDATHFKSVVQSLTGKDSPAAAKASAAPSCSGQKTERAREAIGRAGGGREQGNDPTAAARVQEGELMGAAALDELRKLLGE